MLLEHIIINIDIKVKFNNKTFEKNCTNQMRIKIIHHIYKKIEMDRQGNIESVHSLMNGVD